MLTDIIMNYGSSAISTSGCKRDSDHPAVGNLAHERVLHTLCLQGAVRRLGLQRFQVEFRYLGLFRWYVIVRIDRDVVIV